MAKLTDQLVGKGEKPKLSPNPDGSGYIRQVNAEAISDIAAPEENVLYVVAGLKYKYLKAPIVEPGTDKVIVPAGFHRVGEASAVALKKGEHGTPVKENQAPKKRPQVFAGPVAFQDDVFYKGKLLENQGGGGGGGSNVAAPYQLKQYELDLDNMEFTCSAEDAEYIFQNNPVAISLDGVVALARDFTDDESKHDYSRSYTFFEFPDDDQIIYYELGIYFDGEEYSSEVKPTDPIGGGGGGGITVPTFTPTTFEIELPDVDIALSSQDCADILQNQYPIITISHAASAEETISLTFVRNNSNSGIEKGQPYTNLQYDLVVDDDEDVYLVGLSFSDNDMKSWCMQINGGGGGTGSEEIYPIAITATPNSTNIEIAPAQNITLADMGEQAPGYTAAAYTNLNPVTYDKPYDAVLAEFGAGHQYLLPLISADSSMLMYGIAEGSMPVFDAEHPCAIMIQLSGSSIDSVMMISDSTYGPDGTLVATSLKGYFYSDVDFSFNASGIRDTDIAAAISAGKIPVAIIDWKYKDYQSWCPIKSFDEEDYYFEGEYKEKAFRLECDGSYWRATWLPVYAEDKQIAADVDYANNKIYFRSLNAMREMQSALPMVKLELHDYTDVDKPLLGYLELTLASQSSDKSECYYTSTQIENGDVKVTTIYVAAGHTYASGSTITIVTLAPAVNP